MKRVFLLIAALLALAISPVIAEGWTVAGGTTGIHFTFDGNTLLLDQTSLDTTYYSSYSGYVGSKYNLSAGGTWAACLVYDSSRDLYSSDPYASFHFAQSSLQAGTIGNITWAANTPNGYTAQLLLGNYYGPGSGNYLTLNVVSYSGGYGSGYPYYQTLAHSFSTTYAAVPEPSSILALAMAVVGTAGIRIRRRR